MDSVGTDLEGSCDDGIFPKHRLETARRGGDAASNGKLRLRRLPAWPSHCCQLVQWLNGMMTCFSKTGGSEEHITNLEHRRVTILRRLPTPPWTASQAQRPPTPA